MAGARQPTNLLLLKGKKHFTKAELKQRLSREVNAASDKIAPPAFLKSKQQKQKFIDLACGLLDANIMSNLDCDALARYIQSEEKYLQYEDFTNRIIELINCFDEPEKAMLTYAKALKEYEGLRDKAFRQCRAAAADLGLTITSRCRLTVPKREEPADPNAELFGDVKTG